MTGKIPLTAPERAVNNAPDNWDNNRLMLLLKNNRREIEEDHPTFYGTLTIEINYQKGRIKTVAITRRQTLAE